MSLAKAVISGTVYRAPEKRFTSNNVPISAFAMNISENEETLVRVIAKGNLAQTVEESLSKGDRVVVLSGKDKGKKGKVLVTMPASGNVVVECINVATCHVKPRRQGEAGGILSVECSIPSSKVNVVCSKCNKPVRIGYVIENGEKIRVCKKCGNKIK